MSLLQTFLYVSSTSSGHSICLTVYYLSWPTEASESCSRANTVEMFSAPTVTEDSKSFASYDRRSVGEYPDDYRTYDVSYSPAAVIYKLFLTS